MAGPLISVVVPAYNAAATISSTLSRLDRQSSRDFEVVVVDDGSVDETARVAQSAAEQNTRIRLIRKSNGGVSSARNTGLAAATGAWILFLDADDWLNDDYFARMLAALSAQPGSRVARCRHVRVAPSGAQLAGPENDPDQDYFFPSLARGATGATHAYLTETALVREVGGFDETLRICEDWDLWQRIARTGAPLAAVPEPLAYYRMQRNSLSSDGARLMADARTVIRRGMSADPRVPRPDPRWALGVPEHNIDQALQPIALWCATWAWAAGKPWRSLLDEVQVWSVPADDQTLVDAFFEGFLLGNGIATSAVVDHLDELAAAAGEIFGEVATRSELPDGAAPWRRGLVHICASAGIDGFGVRNVTIPTGRLLPKVPAAAAGEYLVVRLRLPRRARRLTGAVHWLPLGRAAMASLVVAAGTQRFFDALRRRTISRLAPTPGPQPGLLMRLRRRAVSLVQRCGWRLEECAVQPAPPGVRQTSQAEDIRTVAVVEDARPADPRAYWEQLFSRPNPWSYESDYERVKYQRTLAMLDGIHIGRTLELACAEGHFTRELASRVEHVQATDISSAALGRATERCRDQRNVHFEQLDFFHDEIPGSWDLIVCSEVLYYTNDEELLASVARKIGAALAPGGMLLSAHAHLVVDNPEESGFDWDHPYGGKRILQVLADAGDLIPVRRLVTPLYSIALFRRRCDKAVAPEEVQQDAVGAVLSPYVESAVLWNGAVRTRSQVARNLGYDVPILMYHRIVDRPNPQLARWALSTAAFERQMNFLRRRGFHTISMEQLVSARRQGRPITGRPIILSFDDAYLDFLENGLPVLRRKGFGATVFTPTAHIAGAADWDARFGPAAPIMDGAQLRYIARLGIEIGSHLHTHTPVGQLSFDALLHEALESRRIIAEIVGSPATVVATPHGTLDHPALSILRTAGFELIATTDHGVASLLDSGRVIPRLEVSDGTLTFLHELLDSGTLEAPTSEELAAEAHESDATASPRDARAQSSSIIDMDR